MPYAWESFVQATFTYNALQMYNAVPAIIKRNLYIRKFNLALRKALIWTKYPPVRITFVAVGQTEMWGILLLAFAIVFFV